MEPSNMESFCETKRLAALVSIASCQVLMSPSSCGFLSPSIPRPSQPVSQFLASNEAINELYKSPKLSLELDG